MSRPGTGRAKGAYTYKGGQTRLYDPLNRCQYCGERAAFGYKMCHDCICEQNCQYMPTPEQIAAEADLIRAENLSSGATNNGIQPPGVPTHSDQVPYMNRMAYNRPTYRDPANAHRQGRVVG